MINTNDLIGLTYGWGHRPGDGSNMTDCFQLACELHRRFNYHDYSPQFDWVYADYADESFPRVKIARWLLENGKRITTPQPAAVMLLPVATGAAMGTMLEDETTIYLGPDGSVVRFRLPAGTGQMFWMAQ